MRHNETKLIGGTNTLLTYASLLSARKIYRQEQKQPLKLWRTDQPQMVIWINSVYVDFEWGSGIKWESGFGFWDTELGIQESRNRCFGACQMVKIGDPFYLGIFKRKIEKKKNLKSSGHMHPLNIPNSEILKNLRIPLELKAPSNINLCKSESSFVVCLYIKFKKIALKITSTDMQKTN